MTEQMERKTVHKWFWVWEFEKEEQWLNAMAMEGWVLDSVGYCTYHFVRCAPGEYTVRLELHDGDDEYFAFMAELGAEYVGSMMRWQFFRRRSEAGEFNLFSDIDSRIAHLKRIANMLILLGFANICIGLATVFNPSKAGFLNLLCACVLMYGLGRIHGKMDGLKQERLLHE